MSFTKRILTRRAESGAYGSRFLVWLLTRTLYRYLQLVYATSRVQICGTKAGRLSFDCGTPVILIYWHSGLFSATVSLYQFPKLPVSLSSPSLDGQIMIDVLRAMGMTLIEGSRNRDPYRSVRDMISYLQQNHTVSLAPDGPKGPRQRVTPTLVRISTHTQVPIVPYGFASRRQRRLPKTWDRLALVWPFNRVVVYVGDPIHPDPHQPFEDTAEMIADALTHVTQKAEALAGTPDHERLPAIDA